MALRRLSKAFGYGRKSEDANTPLLLGEDQIADLYKTSSEDIPKKLKTAAHGIQLIREHSNLAESIKVSKERLSDYRRLLQQLSDSYHENKRICGCFQHELYKELVENTLKAFELLCLNANAENEETENPLANLIAHARKFSQLEHKVVLQEEMYRDISPEDLLSEVAAYQREEHRLRQEKDSEVLKFDRLRTGLERLDDYCFLRRQTVLRYMVEEAIVDCLVDV